MARVQRIQLQQQLEAVQPGLSKKEKYEQSTCFCFVNGRVYTYNDEITCRAKTGLPKNMEGAVQARPLLAALGKMKDDEVDIEIVNNELVVSSADPKKKEKKRSHRSFGVRMDSEVTLPLEKVERPEKGDWKPLHANFSDAISTVKDCAGTDESQFAFTCIHIASNWIEACDNNQLTRYRLKTGVKVPIMVRRDSIKHITPLDMTHFAETDVWIHFKNPAGIELACKRNVEKYPKLEAYLEARGVKTILPKGIADDADFAETFSKEVEDANLVIVTLKPGRMVIKGIGVSGWASTPKKVKYSGPPIAFSIPPQLLGEITKKHTECQISAEHLRVDGGKWTYISCLSSPQEAEKIAERAAESERLTNEDPGEDTDSQWEADEESGDE